MPDTEPELQTGTLPNRLALTPATAANSTTLQQLDEAKRRAKLVIATLTTFASLLLTVPTIVPVSPVVAVIFVVLAVVLVLVAIAVAWRTNALTPEQLEQLVGQLVVAGHRLPTSLPSPAAPSDGHQVNHRQGPPEP